MSPIWIIAMGLLAADGAAQPPRAAQDQRDVLILLDGGPLHVRLNVSLAGTSLAESRQQYVETLFKRLDGNSDGKLSRDEANRSPLFRTKSRPNANAFLEGLRAQTGMKRRDIEQKVGVVGGELVVFREDLTSAKNDLEVFKLLDADGDSKLSEDELLAAGELVVSKDEDGDQCVSFEEFFPPPPPPDPMQVAVGLANPELPPIARFAELVGGVSATDARMPRQVVAKYRQSRRDLNVGQAELGWSAEKFAALDADKNGRLDVAELSSLGQTKPALELAVDLQRQDLEGGAIGIQSVNGTRLDDGGRPDYAKLRFPTAIITFSLRNADTLAEAIDEAMRQFNALDADANGYLDRDEAAQRTRFERGLFELLDADGDEKVFADEMKEYQRAWGEPKAMTCVMNVYDTGNGFFMALDANADGRVSERERRSAALALAQLERDGQTGISEKEPVKHYHVEFVRGSAPLFGPSEQLVSQTPAFQQRRPTGPIWFQRMDRNNDGDLTWGEFLGPRSVFEQLDGDADDLLDPNEAAKAN